jgi:hypothetical protein
LEQELRDFSTFRFSLLFSFLPLSLFGHVITPVHAAGRVNGLQRSDCEQGEARHR